MSWASLTDIVDRHKSHQSFTLTVFDNQHLDKKILYSQILIINKMKTTLIKILRWTLRILSGIFILFFLVMFIGETLDSANPLSANAILQVSLIGLSLIGLGLAWKWELWGGIIALAAYAGLAILNPDTLHFSLLLLYPATAILFIVLWAISRNAIVKNEHI